MTSLLKRFTLALLAALLPLTGMAVEDTANDPGGRAVAIQMEAKVVDVDLEHRTVSLETSTGDVVTLASREQVVKLEDVSIGDMLVVTYLMALEGEVREPTAEEKAEPWLVVEDAGVSEEPGKPAIGAARKIRAVVTIEGMNRQSGTVTVKDSRGKLHLIGGVEPEKMEGVTLGQYVVMIYTEALALSLEKKASAAAE
jgi:hypothetical protein